MKKIFFSLLAFVTVFTSCMDKEEIDIAYEAKFQVSAENLFSSFHEIYEGDFTLTNHDKLHLRTLIYDTAGNLLLDEQSSGNTMQHTLELDLNLDPGEYTAVSLASFSFDDILSYWEITPGQKLADLTIRQNDNNDDLFKNAVETLGLTTTKFTIGEKNEAIKVDVKPVTGLIEVFYWNKDMTGYGENGLCEFMPYIKDLSILASVQKRIVKFENNQMSFDYIAQNHTYKINSLDIKNDSTSPIVYGYRAALPEKDKKFFWSMDFKSGKGEYFGFKSDSNESDFTTTIDIESGKQYVMDLVLDGLYLFVKPYDATESPENRLREEQIYLNRRAFEQIMDRRFDEILGSSRSFIISQFNKPFIEDETMLLYTKYNRYISYLKFYLDDTSSAEAISLYFVDGVVDFTPDVLYYLDKRFTVFEKGTSGTQKAYINAKNLETATVGIVWYVNTKRLDFVKLK